jgi:hypothetical protein
MTVPSGAHIERNSDRKSFEHPRNTLYSIQYMDETDEHEPNAVPLNAGSHDEMNWLTSRSGQELALEI